MSDKDIAEKNLEAWNDVFADIVNVLLFNGKRVVLEEDLEAETPNSMFKVDGKLHEQTRDVSKIWKNGEIRISILGFENQTKQDYKMPLRVISYDGASYKQQLVDEKAKKNYPVVTLVLYFGTESRWTAPKNLRNCFEIPEDLTPFVSDYKINVFEIAWLDEETINSFSSDFKIVAQYFQAKRQNKSYVGSKDIIKHVDETLKMLSVLTGDNTFEKVYNDSNFEKGGVSMCEVVQRIINEGKAAGRAEGINEGRAEGRTEGRNGIIINLVTAKAGTIEQIAQWVKLPVDEVKRIAESAASNS